MAVETENLSKRLTFGMERILSKDTSEKIDHPAFRTPIPIRPIPARPYTVPTPPKIPEHNSRNTKRKRSWSRAVFSNLQRKGLERRFQIQKYITKPDRRLLAATLGLTDAQVKVWFQNRRMKWRHSNLQNTIRNNK